MKLYQLDNETNIHHFQQINKNPTITNKITSYIYNNSIIIVTKAIDLNPRPTERRGKEKEGDERTKQEEEHINTI